MYPYNNTNSMFEMSSEDISTAREDTRFRCNPKNEKKVLAMLEEALADEISDYEYYRRFQSLFDDTSDREIIRNIALDELKHKKMVEALYKNISGKDPVVPKVDEIKISRNILAELSKKIMSEYEGEEFYRKLYFEFTQQECRDIIFEIMTDENMHAGKLTYLYAKCK